MSQTQLLIGIVLMGIACFLMRILPPSLLRGRTIPHGLISWMSFLPVTIFSAMIFIDVMFMNGSFSLNPLNNLKLLPSALAILVAMKMKNLIYTVIIGVAAIYLMTLI